MSEYKVGDHVEFPWYPGALYRITHIDEPLSRGVGSLTYTVSGGVTVSSRVAITNSPSAFFSYPCIHATLVLPAPGQRWTECPQTQSLWISVTDKLKYVPEMGVLAYFASWYPATFEPAWISVFPWKQKTDPPKRYAISRRRRVWHQQHRGVA